MKAVVIYYSLDGNTRFMAEAISKQLNADIIELKTVGEKKRDRALKMLQGSWNVIFKNMPEINDFDSGIDKYELIFIGTPVWVGNYVPAFRTFFSRVKLKGKKIALFCCHRGGKGNVFNKMETQLNGNEIIGRADFFKVLKNKEKSLEKMDSWLNKII